LASNGGTAFAKNVISGYAAHTIAHLNDGTYSFGSFALDTNSSAWGDGSATYLRHVCQFAPISGVTGVRVLLDTANASIICIDELEVYAAVPEPSPLLLVTVGLVALLGYARRKR
jgi:hypothetical protein